MSVIENDASGKDCETNASPLHSWNSATDLDEYGRVPWPEFALQVQDLCERLWPAQDEGKDIAPQKKSLGERVLGHSYKRLADMLKIDKQSIELQGSASASTPDRFIIEQMRGGTFNRVVGITVLSPTAEIPQQRFVLRVPRYNNCKPQRDIDILKFVKQYDIAPVPMVAAADCSRTNPLHNLYIVLERVPGNDLQFKKRSWPDLTHEQKKTFVKHFAKLQLRLQCIRHPYAGQIDKSRDGNGNDVFTVGPLHVGRESDELAAIRAEQNAFFRKPTYVHDATTSKENEAIDQCTSATTNKDLSEERLQHTKDAEDPSEPWVSSDDDDSDAQDIESPYYFICAQLGRWKQQALEDNPASIRSSGSTVLDKLVTAATQMESYSWLDDDITCLCHCDLDPRNIMVDISPTSGTLSLTAILDWDLAIFAPRWVGCKPPSWIWDWVDGENEDEEGAWEEPRTEEGRELKRLWEDEVGLEDVWYAYDSHWRLARAIFMVARFGLTGPGYYMAATKFLGEWGYLNETAEAEDGEGEGGLDGGVDGEVSEGGGADDDVDGDGETSSGGGSEEDSTESYSEKQAMLMEKIAETVKTLRDAYQKSWDEGDEEVSPS